jgi:hypothetical protein
MAASNVVTIDNWYLREIGCVADYDLAFANPTQSDQVQDRSTNLADGTASAGVTQVTKIEAVNTNKLNVGGTTPLVGIGLPAGSTPTTLLNVYRDNALVGEQVRIENDGTGDATLSFVATGTASWMMGLDTSDSSSFKIGKSNVNLATETKLTIDSAGNVGVGESSPDSLLTVGGNSTATTIQPTAIITDGAADGQGAGGKLTIRGRSPVLAFDATAAGVPTVLMDSQGIAFKDGTLDSHGTAHLTIDSTGLATFSAGIAFSGQTDAAGMTATTLNHYETGTWTPVHNATWSTQPVVGSGTTPVFSGTYTRVGNIVHATVILDFDDTASIAVDDRWTISGLPFTPAATDFTGSNSFFIYASLGSGNNAMGVVGASGTSGDRCLFYVTNVDGALTYATVLRAEFTYKV